MVGSCRGIRPNLSASLVLNLAVDDMKSMTTGVGTAGLSRHCACEPDMSSKGKAERDNPAEGLLI